MSLRQEKLSENCRHYPNKAFTTCSEAFFFLSCSFHNNKKKSLYVMFSSIVSVHYTTGGVEINEKAQVLNMAGNPNPNLYAAGEVTGGVHGNNRLGTLSIPDTVTFGRIAAKTCWKENH